MVANGLATHRPLHPLHGSALHQHLPIPHLPAACFEPKCRNSQSPSLNFTSLALEHVPNLNDLSAASYSVNQREELGIVCDGPRAGVSAGPHSGLTECRTHASPQGARQGSGGEGLILEAQAAPHAPGQHPRSEQTLCHNPTSLQD